MPANPHITAMWRTTIFWGVFVYLLAMYYVWIESGQLSFSGISSSAALAGGVFIGTSFGLSGLSYFFNYFDPLLQYRKYIGLVGYYFALLHAVTLPIRFPDSYLGGFPQSLLTPQTLLGLAAMTILSMMAVISHMYWMKKLGKHWRPLLRLGYIAYGLLVIRATIIEHENWLGWLASPEGLPPGRLLLSCFAVGVILLRIGLELAIRFFPRAKAAVITPSLSA